MIANELDEMLVRRLADLDDAARPLDAISENVGNAMDELAREWIRVHGWPPPDGTWNDDWDISLGPPEWKPNGTWVRWFALDFGDGDDGHPAPNRDYFWLTRLCGEGEGTAGFRFMQEEVPKVGWKKFLKANGNPLLGMDFELDDAPSLYLPVRISVDELATAVREERIEDALTPLHDALDALHRAKPEFDKLIAEAKKARGAK
ncbi:MAG TPA: hypothetical protein VNX29_17890 [Kaistia sp.]|nr:hypothetical protein [Kaistia sp.]